MRAGGRRAAWLVAALEITLLAGSCGGSDDDAETSASPPSSDDETASSTTSPDSAAAEGATGEPSAGGSDVCALLEGVDASALLGEPAGQPRSDGTVCRVAPTNADSRGQFGLVVETDRPADNFETQQEVFGVDTEVAGLGDAAFHSGGYLFVLDGGTFFFLQAVRDASLGLGVPDGELEAAARTVIGNLES